MSKNTVQGAEKRAFTKMFMNICNWNNYWERWNDMLWMFAIGISNSIDYRYLKEREETYRHIAGKYSEAEMTKFAELFNAMVAEFERQPFQDFLGSIYMELEMGSDTHGQFFTPYNICSMCAQMSIDEDIIREQIQKHGWISVHDCASGAGALLIAGAQRLYDLGINYQQNALFVAQDLDSTVAMMCYIQLSLLGCAGYVRIGDTLSDPVVHDVLFGDGEARTWYTPMYFSSTWTGRLLCRKIDRMNGLKPKEAPAKRPEEKTKRREEPKDDGRAIQLSLF